MGVPGRKDGEQGPERKDEAPGRRDGGSKEKRGGERVPGIREGWGRRPAPRNLGGTFLWRERVRAVQPQKESLRSRWGGGREGYGSRIDHPYI